MNNDLAFLTGKLNKEYKMWYTTETMHGCNHQFPGLQKAAVVPKTQIGLPPIIIFMNSALASENGCITAVVEILDGEEIYLWVSTHAFTLGVNRRVNMLP